MGGAWIDPDTQINFYDSFLWSLGIADSGLRTSLTEYQTHAITNIFGYRFENASSFLNMIMYNQTTH
jgi:hypothetical protein